MERIPFHQPSIDEADVAGVLEVLREGWLTTGPRCREFERAFGEFLGGGLHCVAVNSCTAGLHLALEAAGVGPDDLVLTTPYTFTATAEVVRYLGADPFFVDVDPATLNLDPATVRAAIEAMPPPQRSRLRAIVPVHFAGLACDMGGLQGICDDFGLRLVDDAAHALPATHGGSLIGSLGDATVFSFYATKTLCTGEGGMVVTRDDALATRMRTMRLHGISRDAFDRYRSERPAWYYEVVAPGFKYNLGDMAASLGITQLARVEEMRRAREAIASRYDEAFSGVEGLHLPPGSPAGETHARHLYPLRVDGGREVRDRMIEELADAGIGTSVHFIPLHLQPYWRDRYDLQPGDYPVATAAFGAEISLPLWPGLSPVQVDRVLGAVPASHRTALQSIATTGG